MPVTEFTMYTATAPRARELAEAWSKVTEHVARPVDVGPELRALWGTDEDAHRTCTVLSAPGAQRGLLRLVDTDLAPPDEPPARRTGPFGLEFFSRDVDEVHRRLVADGTFRTLHPPCDYDMSSIGSGVGRSFAAAGPGGVWVLVTTMLSVPPPRPVPRVEQLVGPVINMPVATHDRLPATRLYHELLGIPIRFDGLLADPAVNSIIDLDADRSFHCTVFSVGDGQMAEHHEHADGALSAPTTRSGRLRPGPAVYTLTVDGSLDEVVESLRVAGHQVRGPLAVPDHPYQGRRVACVDGANGELVELVGS